MQHIFFKKVVFNIMILTGLSGFLLQSCSYSAKTSQKLYNEASKKSYDIIVVPGVPLENGLWSNTMKARIYWSKHLYDMGIAKNIMFTGSSVYSPYYEAEVMALYAEALGVKKEHIFTETKAEHSTENLYYSYKKAQKLGFKNIALASDPFQSKLLSSFARKRLSVDVGIIPMVMDTMRRLEKTMTDPVIDPQPAFNSKFVSIKKRESFWKRLRGTMGKNIDYKAYE